MKVALIDVALLESLERKTQVLRDRVRGVALGYQTAAYLVGRPGVGKTHTVKEELEKCDVPHLVKNSRMSPMGLFKVVAEHPEHVIVLDDIGTLYKSEQALQILMAVMGGNPKTPRLITYTTKDHDEVVEFSGGIIAISNLPLKSDPLAAAVASRVVPVSFEPSDEELAAFMRRLVSGGHDGLDEEECLGVAEFVIKETRACEQRLDLRHFTKGLQDLLQWKEGNAKTHWQDLIRCSLRKLLLGVPTKAEEIEHDRKRVADAIHLFPDDIDKQIATSGLSRPTFYRRKKEVESGLES